LIRSLEGIPDNPDHIKLSMQMKGKKDEKI
jgi:hypothetical protein